MHGNTAGKRSTGNGSRGRGGRGRDCGGLGGGRLLLGRGLLRLEVLHQQRLRDQQDGEGEDEDEQETALRAGFLLRVVHVSVQMISDLNFSRPLRDLGPGCASYPALKCRAIVIASLRDACVESFTGCVCRIMQSRPHECRVM